MSTLIRRKWTRVAFQGGFPVLLRRHVSQAAHGAFFVEELDIARDRGGDVLGVADAEVDEHLPAWRPDRPSRGQFRDRLAFEPEEVTCSFFEPPPFTE